MSSQQWLIEFGTIYFVMVITEAKPPQVIDWFMSGQSTLDLLCVLLAPKRNDQQRVKELIEDHSAYDAIMGRRIGFLVMSPAEHDPLALRAPYGQRYVFPGSIIRDLRELDGLEAFRPPDVYGRMATEMAAHMAHFVPEFMELLGVDAEALPALCVLVYGEEHYKTISLGADWTADQVGQWLLELAKLSAHVDRTSHQRSPDIAFERFRSMNEEVQSLERGLATRKVKLADRFTTLGGKHRFTDEDRLLVARFLQAPRLSRSGLDLLFEQLSARTRLGLAKDNNSAPAIRKLVEETEELQGRITDIFDTSTSSFESIPALHRSLVARSATILEHLNSLQLPGSTTKVLAERFDRFEKLFAYVGKVRDALGKLSFLGPLLLRLDKLLGL